MTGIRFEHPVWIAENCTACGNCYTVCPDSAIPGLVSSVSRRAQHASSTASRRSGTPTRFLRRVSRTVEKKLRGLIDRDGVDRASPLIDQAIAGHRGRSARRQDREKTGRRIQPVRREHRRLPVRHHQALLDAEGEEGQGQRRPVLDHRQSLHLQGLRAVRRRLRRRRAEDGHADRRDASRRCATTGSSGSTCRPRRRNTAASTTSTRRSARWRPCCSTSTTTTRWPAATAPASAAARRPRSTCSPPPSPR